MNFDWPLMLLLLLLVPVAIGGYVLIQRRRNRYAVRFTNLDLLANVVDEEPQWRRHVPAAFYLIAVAALIVALARPTTVQKVPKEEATVVLVMDVSGSMNATDVSPTRLEAVKSSAISLIDELPQKFKISLVAFANSVQVVVPPTSDKDAVKRGLNALLANGGTAMGDAILQGVNLANPPQLPDGPAASGTATPAATPTPTVTPAGVLGEKPGVVVLLSDGANSVGSDPIQAANVAASRNVPVYTIAVGTDRGTVEVPDQAGIRRRIAVPPDLATLQQIAEITKAKFFEAPNAGELKSIYNDLGSRIGFDVEDREITVLFSGIAAIAMIAAGGLSLLWFNRFP